MVGKNTTILIMRVGLHKCDFFNPKFILSFIHDFEKIYSLPKIFYCHFRHIVPLQKSDRLVRFRPPSRRWRQALHHLLLVVLDDPIPG